MGAAGSHPLRLGPALWKFTLRQRRTIVRLYLLACLALRAYRYGLCLDGRWGLAGGTGHTWALIGKEILKRKK